MKLAVIVLAAGASKRFGAPNKLLQDFGGKPLLQAVFDLAMKVPVEKRIAVCSTETLPLAEKNGFTAILNGEPEKGQSSSMRLGVAECFGCDGAMFLTGDQPFVLQSTLDRLIAVFSAEPEAIVGCSIEGHFCIPSIFPASLFAELLAQQGDIGGREVMRTHADRVRRVPIQEEEHFDIDTPEDFRRAVESHLL